MTKYDNGQTLHQLLQQNMVYYIDFRINCMWPAIYSSAQYQRIICK